MTKTPILAPFWRRGLASLFDALLMTLVAILLTSPFLPLQERLDDYLQNPTFENRKQFLEVRNTVRNVALLCWFIYAVALEASAWKATIGKKLLGLCVVSFDGEQISLTQSIKRAIVKFFSLIPAGLGFLWAIFTKKHLTWHDSAAKTVVIRSVSSLTQ